MQFVLSSPKIFAAALIFLALAPDASAFQRPTQGVVGKHVPHGDLEGFVRDQTSTPVPNAHLSFRRNGTDSSATPQFSAADKTGHYRLTLPPGKWDIAASSEQRYSSIITVDIFEQHKTAVDLQIRRIEKYSPSKDGAWDRREPCAPERVAEKTWAAAAEDRKVSWKPETEPEYQLRIGNIFMQTALLSWAPPSGSPAATFVRTQSQSTQDSFLRDAEERLSCADRLLTGSCSHGNRTACDRETQLTDTVGLFYWGTSLRYLSPPKNYALALHWAQRGAAAGYVQSMKTLGEYYLDGVIVEKDHPQAFKWFKAAAQGGCPSAMIVVSRMYGEGDGTEKNLREAVFWASLGGFSIPAGLSRSELAEVQELTAAWKPSKDARGKCTEPTASDSHAGSSSLPIVLRAAGTVGADPVVTIKNNSGFNWRILFAGPSNYDVPLTPEGSKTIALMPGTYLISGECSSTNVTGFSPANYTFPKDVFGTLTITVQ